MGVNFSYFVFIVSTLIFFMFFIANKFYIFRDFIKVNTILFSIVYIGNYIYSFITQDVNFIEIDFINSFLILVFFILTIYSDNFLLKKPHSDKALTIYFFVYFFLFVAFYLYLLLSSLSITFAFLGFVFSLFCFFGVPRIGLFENSVIPLRILSLVFSYIGIIFSVLHGYMYGWSLFLILILFFSSYFNIYVHRLYANFVSLSFGLFSAVMCIFQVFFLYLSSFFFTSEPFIVYTFVWSLLIVISPMMWQSKDIIEHYFFHIFSYITNITGVVYFFLLSGFDIFTF